MVSGQAIEIDARGHGLFAIIPTVPCYRMGSGGHEIILDSRDFAAGDIEDFQFDMGWFRQIKADRGNRVKWVGVVLIERE